eukprot:jgi/Psemu1/292825/fgenesh1_pg.1355_\
MSSEPPTTNHSPHPGMPQLPSTIKKRPYRRTKRPKNYCDRSTVTTVTTPTRVSVSSGSSGREHDAASSASSAFACNTNPDGTNVYDAVLGECEDLLRASTEAQRLGRLKMASAYQLLLHTRLVGLGKRFDRSAMMSQSLSQSKAPPKRLQLLDPPAADSAPAPSASATAAAAVPVALQQLRSILPGNLEMDASMMEHLARAAVELHHQRTGRKQSADGLLASPPHLQGGRLLLATTTSTSTGVGAGTSPLPPSTAEMETNHNNAEASQAQVQAQASASASAKPGKSSVVWTQEETATVHRALGEGTDPHTIAKTLLPHKTVGQAAIPAEQLAPTTKPVLAGHPEQ